MTPIPAMSAKQLERARERAAKEFTAAAEALIAAGRGKEKLHDLVYLTDALAVRYSAAMTRFSELNTEKHRRLEAHGNLKPITRH